MYLETQIYREINEIEAEYKLLIEYDYQPEEYQDRQYPGCQAEVEITKVTCEGVDFELTNDEQNSLEIECLYRFQAGEFQGCTDII